MLKCPGSYFLTRQCLQLTFHLLLHCLLQFSRGCYQHRLTIYSMFSLTQQISCHKHRIGCLIGQHQHFRRTRWHIDSHIAHAHQLFGSCNILITWPEYLIHLWHCLCTIGHGSNGLHTTYFIYMAYTGCTGSEQHGRMHLSIPSRRSTQHNLAATGNLCRHSQHQHRRKQGSRSTWDIQSHFLDGNRFLPAHHTRLCLHLYTGKSLCLMEFGNVLLRQ